MEDNVNIAGNIEAAIENILPVAVKAILFLLITFIFVLAAIGIYNALRGRRCSKHLALCAGSFSILLGAVALAVLKSVISSPDINCDGFGWIWLIAGLAIILFMINLRGKDKK